MEREDLSCFNYHLQKYLAIHCIAYLAGPCERRFESTGRMRTNVGECFLFVSSALSSGCWLPSDFGGCRFNASVSGKLDHKSVNHAMLPSDSPSIQAKCDALLAQSSSIHSLSVEEPSIHGFCVPQTSAPLCDPSKLKLELCSGHKQPISCRATGCGLLLSWVGGASSGQTALRLSQEISEVQIA